MSITKSHFPINTPMGDEGVSSHFSIVSNGQANGLSGGLLMTEFVAELSAELIANGQDRTARAYRTAGNGLIRFVDRKEFTLEDISDSLMRSYEIYIYDKKRRRNTISFHMRLLRAMYNKAIACGKLLPQQEWPFKNVSTGVYETKKRALDEDRLSQLSVLSIDLLAKKTAQEAPETTPQATPATPQVTQKEDCLFAALYYFLFCFHARGMSFIDMAYLRKSDVCGDEIRYCRKKTRRYMRIKITPQMRTILDYFARQTGDSPYLFPLLNPKKGDLRQQYETALTSQNRRLKILAAMSGITSALSTHVARHSWATIAKKQHYPIAVICEALGHRDERTTSIYLDSFDDSVIDNASEQISKLFAV